MTFDRSNLRLDEAPGMIESPQHGRHQHRRYVMTCEDFDQLWSRGGGRCEICGVLWRYTPHGMLHIDHNPLLGDWAVRGLLCSRCNTQLGTPGRLKGAEVDKYLANPWRTVMPARLAGQESKVALGDFAEVFAEYRAVRAENEAAWARLQQGILERRGAMPIWEIVKLTGLTRERVKAIFARADMAEKAASSSRRRSLGNRLASNRSIH